MPTANIGQCAQAAPARQEAATMNDAWTCHARPARLGGKPCGHVNDGPKQVARIFGDDMEYCAACGCTKRASEIREAREAKNPLPMLDLMEGRRARRAGR